MPDLILNYRKIHEFTAINGFDNLLESFQAMFPDLDLYNFKTAWYDANAAKYSLKFRGTRGDVLVLWEENFPFLVSLETEQGEIIRRVHADTKKGACGEAQRLAAIYTDCFVHVTYKRPTDNEVIHLTAGDIFDPIHSNGGKSQ